MVLFFSTIDGTRYSHWQNGVLISESTVLTSKTDENHIFFSPKTRIFVVFKARAMHRFTTFMHMWQMNEYICAKHHSCLSHALASIRPMSEVVPVIIDEMVHAPKDEQGVVMKLKLKVRTLKLPIAVLLVPLREEEFSQCHVELWTVPQPFRQDESLVQCPFHYDKSQHYLCSISANLPDHATGAPLLCDIYGTIRVILGVLGTDWGGIAPGWGTPKRVWNLVD